MKKLIGFISIAMFLATGSIYAESYLGIGTGLQFNLGSLGNTISVDGLDSRALNRNNGKQQNCDQDQNKSAHSCQASGTPQDAIVAENKLITIEKSTGGLVRADTNGPMTGIVLDLFYEDQSDGFFYRAGIQHVRKISGGQTSSSVFAGSPFEVQWLDITWDYYAWHVPLYYGVNVAVGDSGSVYAGAGINYSEGGWNLGGNNLGDIPTAITGLPIGAHTARDAGGGITGGSVYAEAAKYRVKGFGFNFLIGVDKKLAGGDKIYFELEQIIGGAQGVTVTKSAGGQKALAAAAAYPINLSGTKYKFGYKMSL